LSARSLLGVNYFFIAFLFVYQIVVIVYQFQGALEFYYFHLGMVQMVVMSSLAKECLARPVSRQRNLLLLFYGFIFVVGMAASSYLYLNVNDIELRQPFLETADSWAGIALIATVTVQVYLAWGRVLTGLIVASILYFTFGDLVPGRFHYASPELEILISYLAGMGGAWGVIWGIPLSANTLFLVIVFGGLMKGTRVLELFNEVGKILLNISRGGTCYSAILASTAIGMVTGQAVANIALSGSVTIPAMQQRGIAKTRAAAIEVVASLGSQLIPPIMGLGGFLIAVNLGVPYSDVAIAAIVPAFLFIAILFIAAFFMAEAELNLQTQSEKVDTDAIKWIAPSFLVSFSVLLTLLYMRYSPGYAAMWAILLLSGMAFLRPKAYRPGLSGLWDGLKYGVNSACNLALILAGIGIIVQVLVTTGAGFDLGRTIMLISDGNLFPALILGMCLALMVGLGLPTPAAYALIAIIMIPFLQDFGVEPLVAHFFGFYFAIFSAITPPVAVGVMAASRISGGSFYGTAYEAGRMSLTAILIPYAFVAYPSILAFPNIGWHGLAVSAALIITTIFWGASIYGVLKGRRLKLVERLLLLLGPVFFVAQLVSKDLFFAFSIFTGFPVFVLWHLYVVRLEAPIRT
jgi:TRAP transporter 4TM/12TM fusion protein